MNVKKLADFLYSSNSSNDVPFRIALTTGQFSAFDLNKEQIIKLFEFLGNEENYNKENFQDFLEIWVYPKERQKNEL